jgi:hypothetical protein
MGVLSLPIAYWLLQIGIRGHLAPFNDAEWQQQEKTHLVAV